MIVQTNISEMGTNKMCNSVPRRRKGRYIIIKAITAWGSSTIALTTKESGLKGGRVSEAFHQINIAELSECG